MFFARRLLFSFMQRLGKREKIKAVGVQYALLPLAWLGLIRRGWIDVIGVF